MFHIAQALPGDFWLAITNVHILRNGYVVVPVNITHALFVALTAEEIGQLLGGN